MGLFDNISDLVPGLGNPFGLPSSGIWNLQQGSFTTGNAGAGILGALGNFIGGGQTVTFYVENTIGQFPNQLTAIDVINDSGGRRLAAYDYPYVDGTTYQDLGRKGERFVMNIKFFGSNYQILFKNFIEVVTKTNQLGTLNHPVRGTFPARFLEWEFVHRHDEFNAVTIKATFVEDNINQTSKLNIFDNINSALRNALQVLSSVVSAIQTLLSAAIALLNLPNQILTNLKTSLSNIQFLFSQLLAQLAATYSTDAQIQNTLSNAITTGGALGANSGTTTASTANPTGQIPPVYQVGFSAQAQASITTNLNNFINANQITPQQALFGANQVLNLIGSAIAEVTENLGNQGYSVVLQYRILAVQAQNVTQSAVSNIQTQVTMYTVPFDMSLRMIAFLNGLSVDRQNDIASLNPYLQSINYISRGTVVQVPAA
jgi:prophage DNA circulation protein